MFQQPLEVVKLRKFNSIAQSRDHYQQIQAQTVRGTTLLPRPSAMHLLVDGLKKA